MQFSGWFLGAIFIFSIPFSPSFMKFNRLCRSLKYLSARSNLPLLSVVLSIVNCLMREINVISGRCAITLLLFVFPSRFKCLLPQGQALLLVTGSTVFHSFLLYYCTGRIPDTHSGGSIHHHCYAVCFPIVIYYTWFLTGSPAISGPGLMAVDGNAAII